MITTFVNSLPMKKLIYVIYLTFFFVFLASQTNAQCTPLDEEGCPDPEGNGEVCPDTINALFVDIPYEQTVTMLAPSGIDTLGFNVDLHHITLIDVEGLPEGIDWVTNAENNEFFVGIYYCILFSGTSTATVGDYPLKVVVDIYANILGQPVKILQLTDSTSLKMEVMDPSSVGEGPQEKLISNVWPNPFSKELNLELTKTMNYASMIEMYNLMGKLVYTREIESQTSVVKVHFDGVDLPEGLYFISVEHGNKKYSQLVSKLN